MRIGARCVDRRSGSVPRRAATPLAGPPSEWYGRPERPPSAPKWRRGPTVPPASPKALDRPSPDARAPTCQCCQRGRTAWTPRVPDGSSLALSSTPKRRHRRYGHSTSAPEWSGGPRSAARSRARCRRRPHARVAAPAMGHRGMRRPAPSTPKWRPAAWRAGSVPVRSRRRSLPPWPKVARRPWQHYVSAHAGDGPDRVGRGPRRPAAPRAARASCVGRRERAAP